MRHKQSMFDFECTSFSNFTFSSSWFGKDILTVVAGDHRLGMAEDNVGVVASSASDIHEVGVGSWDESFKFVAISLLLFGWV